LYYTTIDAHVIIDQKSTNHDKFVVWHGDMVGWGPQQCRQSLFKD